MHMSTIDIPVKIDIEAATARQQRDFGVASGAIGAEHFRMDAGTDLAPLLRGLHDDACQAAHWGVMLRGAVVVDYSDDTSETCRAGEVMHWPAGHTVRAAEDAEFVLFSPQDEHTPVLDHVRDQLVAG